MHERRRRGIIKTVRFFTLGVKGKDGANQIHGTQVSTTFQVYFGRRRPKEAFIVSMLAHGQFTMLLFSLTHAN
jgi:hypothetical protein